MNHQLFSNAILRKEGCFQNIYVHKLLLLSPERKMELNLNCIFSCVENYIIFPLLSLAFCLNINNWDNNKNIRSEKKEHFIFIIQLKILFIDIKFPNLWTHWIYIARNRKNVIMNVTLINGILIHILYSGDCIFEWVAICLKGLFGPQKNCS